jgi:hypothetical protein
MSVLAATVFFVLAVWSIVWKGFALWISAKEGKKWWFIPILIFNTAGILEIIYIFFFSQTGKRFIGEFKKHRAHKKSHKKSKHIALEKTEDSSDKN